MVQGSVFAVQPNAEALDAAAAIAEHGFRFVADASPVEGGGFAPQVPSVKREASCCVTCYFLKNSRTALRTPR